MALLLIIFILIAGCSGTGHVTQNASENNPSQIQNDSPDDTKIEVYETNVDPGEFLVRQKYFEEAFRPKRNEYQLFEKAAQHLGLPVNRMPETFSLNSESEIFSNLPDVPNDFSEVAYLLASGRSYDIGILGPEYYLQPEFYPGFKDNGLKYWAQPDPKYWVTNGFGTYPSEQFDTLNLSGRDEFTAVVFFYSGYGVQTYQGGTIVPTSEALRYFDISVTPDTVLLGPTFPKFEENWAQRIVITGKMKPDTSPGEYTVGFLVVKPPQQKRDEWAFKYRNLYFDAATGIAPAGFPIKFNVKVGK